MKILITGVTGFLGGSVGRYAEQRGHTVLGISRSDAGTEAWSGGHIRADLLSLDFSSVMRDFAPDLVVHATGTASVSGSFAAPLADLNSSLMPWAAVLEGIRRSEQHPAILFPSSAAVYGNPEKLPVHEDAPVKPISPYGFHKAMCELLAQEYADCFKLNVTICRLFSVFGSDQRRLLVWELYERLTGSEPYAWLDGTGNETRDYLSIDDVAAAFLQLAKQGHTANSTIVNIASGQETSVLGLATAMRDLVAPEKEVRCRGAARLGDPLRWRADITRLKALAPDWQPQPIDVGLTNCVAEWRKSVDGSQRGPA